MNEISIIKKLVRSDGCDSKPGKIKKTVTIMASTSSSLRLLAFLETEIAIEREEISDRKRD